MKHLGSSSFTLVLAAVLGVSFSGCRLPGEVAADGWALSMAGVYNGYVTRGQKDSSKQAFADGKLSQDPSKKLLVHLDAHFVDQQFKEQNEAFDFSVALKDKTHLSFTFTGILEDTQTLDLGAENCFFTKNSPTDPSVRICPTTESLSVNVTIPSTGFYFSADLQKYRPDLQPTLEKPASYSLRELTDRTKSLNFQNQIEFKKVLQAKYTAQNVRAQLLPSFHFPSFFQLDGITLGAFEHALGDLAPFLFPTRWIKAKSAQFQYKAEQQSLLIMKADSVNIVEGLAYSVLRDQELYAAIQKYQPSIEIIYKKLLARENAGDEPRGTADNAATVIYSIQSLLNNLQYAIKSELGDTASASGFLNPEAVTAITTSSIDFPDLAANLDFSQVKTLALERSLELRQNATLVADSKNNQTGRYFQWSDPAGESGGGAGPGLPSYIQIGKAQIGALEEQRIAITSALSKKSVELVSSLTGSVQGYTIAYNKYVNEVDKLKIILADFNAGQAVSFSIMQQDYQSALDAEMATINARYNYYISMAQLKRLMFTDEYAQLSIDPTPVPNPRPGSPPSELKSK